MSSRIGRNKHNSINNARCKHLHLLLVQIVWTAMVLHLLSGGTAGVDAFFARSARSCRNSNSDSFRLQNSNNNNNNSNDDNLLVLDVEPNLEPELELDDPNSVSSRVFDGADQRPVVLFDGVCNLCNNAVNLALDWDPGARLRFCALQSSAGRSLLEANGRSADDISSIVLVTKNDGALVKSDAVLRITQELAPAPLLPLLPLATAGRVLLPRVLRDAIYDNVADNRYALMGKRNECRFDADGEFEDRFVSDDVAFKRKD